MPRRLSELLRETIDRELPHLLALPSDRAAAFPAGPDSWSPKQELGHLIDSAVNNHQRFVRASIEPEYRGPGYAQNDWVRIHDWHNRKWTEIVDFWYRFNTFLVSLTDSIPEDKLSTPCFIGSSPAAPLSFVVEDYVLHMQHHIDHLLGRAIVTAYPTDTKRPI